MAAQALLQGEAEKITRKCVQLALKGDLVAIRLCLERIVPVVRPELSDLEQRIATMEQADRVDDRSIN
jgi:hypothetical protein